MLALTEQPSNIDDSYHEPGVDRSRATGRPAPHTASRSRVPLADRDNRMVATLGSAATEPIRIFHASPSGARRCSTRSRIYLMTKT